MEGTNGEGKRTEIQAETKGNVGYGFVVLGIDDQIVLSVPSWSH